MQIGTKSLFLNPNYKKFNLVALNFIMIQKPPVHSGGFLYNLTFLLNFQITVEIIYSILYNN